MLMFPATRCSHPGVHRISGVCILDFTIYAKSMAHNFTENSDILPAHGNWWNPGKCMSPWSRYSPELIQQVVAGAILHRVNNKLIMLVGALGYVAAFLLYSLNKTSYGYWPMIFPGLCCAVVGADLQFNVTNASKHPRIFGLAMLMNFRCTSCRLCKSPNKALQAAFSRRSLD